MDVREMVFRGEDETNLYACGKCGQCYSPRIYACGPAQAHEAARRAAEQCCVPPTCSVCGVEIEKPWTKCARHRERDALRRAVPILASEWTDPVHRDDMGGDCGSGYSSNVAHLLGWWDAENWVEVGPLPEPPAWCWPCKPTDFQLDLERILENALEEFHEDAGDSLVDTEELYAFVEAWNKKQTLTTWYPDHTRVVVIDEARFQAIVNGD